MSRLISFSVDPQREYPDRSREYARRYRGPSRVAVPSSLEIRKRLSLEPAGRFMLGNVRRHPSITVTPLRPDYRPGRIRGY